MSGGAGAGAGRVFGDAAGQTVRRKRKRPAPLSVRLSAEERARLERDAGAMALGAYVRLRLFGEDVKPRRGRRHAPVKDHEALGRVLAALGRSGLHAGLNRLSRQLDGPSVTVKPETQAALRGACADIAAMRRALMAALGLRPA